MKFQSFCVFFLLSLVLCAQNQEREIDSLLEVAKTANDSTRFAILNDVGFYYIFNKPEKAKELLNRALTDAQNTSDQYSIARLTNTYGIYYDVSGKFDSAQFYFRKALDLSKVNGVKSIEARATNSLGMSHWNQGKYQEALDYFFQALALNRQSGEPINDAKYLNNIGLIYQELNLVDKALEYHYQALELRKQYKVVRDIPKSLNNIAINLQDKGDFDEAEKILKEAITISEENNDLATYFESSHSLARLYQELDRNEEAIPILKKAIEGRISSGVDKVGAIASVNNIAEAYLDTGNVKQALTYLALGEELLEEFPDEKVTSFELYYCLSRAHFMNNNPTLGNAYFVKALEIKDAVFSEKNAATVADLETKYNVAENEKQLAETRAYLAETELEVEQRNVMIYGGVALVAIFALIGYLFFSRQKMKNKQLQKESELREALARIETQNRLQEQRLRISRDLHDNIGAQLTFVTSSVDNLKYGLKDEQKEVGEKLETISAFTTQTIYELRDTIWAMNKNDITIEDMQVRIANFIDRARYAAASVLFNFEIDPSLSVNKTFSSTEGMNLYRIIQESVNNALKYAQPKHIDVRISEDKTQLLVVISDDGCGFDTVSTPKGNGLLNIEKRVHDLGGFIKLTSEIDKGTTVIVSLPKTSI